MNKPAELAEGQQFQKNMMSFVIQLAALAALIAYCIIIVGPFALSLGGARSFRLP
jgi:K+ transporter